MVGSIMLSLAIMGFGIYLYTQGQKALPIFLVGVGLAFTPWRVIGLLGALVCIAALVMFDGARGGLLSRNASSIARL